MKAYSYISAFPFLGIHHGRVAGVPRGWPPTAKLAKKTTTRTTWDNFFPAE